ncbi:MAG: hypothetical protein FK730_02100 [Asgard group archaeon]|nr:hypothetical protein [Asgard group archaeon]
MSQEKADSGTVLLNSAGVELGVIKKIYSQNLARLELADSTSIALDLSLITDVTTSGRLIKKKSAIAQPEIDIFFIGASEILEQLIVNSIKLLSEHLSTKEIKKALQYFEFDFLTKYDFTDNLEYYKLLGLIRGIELAGKTAQDFLVKSIFQASESYPELNNLIAPEILVDKLNQEKAFSRILWNLLRLCVSQKLKLKDGKLILAIADALFDIGLNVIEIEFKAGNSTADLLYWNERIEDCIFKYIALMFNTQELDDQMLQIDEMKAKYSELIKKSKINGSIKTQIIKIIENFNPKDYEEYKTIELLHSGIKGFNLQVMSEKKAMNDLKLIVNSLLEEEKPISMMALEKEITKFSKEIRDVSREFLDTLLQIAQYLKKLEYGDSKTHEYYSSLREIVYNKRYTDLGLILDLLNKTYIK